MNKHTSSWNYLEFAGLDLELFLCSEVLKLHSLHYGYWRSNEKPTLHNLRRSQQRYTDTLISVIPPNVKTVLDVGCGLGDVSHTLVNHDYVVTAISPDKNHQKYFTNETKNLSFIRTTFEEFTSHEHYDLILMSESQNYFHTDVGFQQCTRYLNSHGYLLVSGIFRKRVEGGFEDVINNEEEYLEKAHQYGFRLLKRADITRQVLPTLVFAHNAMREYLQPIGVMVAHYLTTSTEPVRKTILRLLFCKQIRDVSDLFRHYQDRTDPSQFEHKCSYLRLLLQLT